MIKSDWPHAMESDHVLWNPVEPIPKVSEIPLLKNVVFHVINRHEPAVDGYQWLHGIALAWHKDDLWASFGLNRGCENTAGEEAHGRKSSDGGTSWGGLFTIDPGKDNLAISHGVFLAHQDELWAFHGAFYDNFQKTHTRAYLMDHQSGRWQSKGVVVDNGFWPLQEPQKMDDGNYIMAGLRAARGYDLCGNLPAVAISHGGNLTNWDLVVIPSDRRMEVESIWGESTVITNGRRIINIARWGSPMALVALSNDYGRTWTPTRPGNLPMADSKPYAGVLSTGQRYLIGTTAYDCGRQRCPLTIAVSSPGSNYFSRIFRIRGDILAGGGACESVKGASLSYPYAVEHGGKFYVCYSNSGGRGGINLNSAELAVFPISELMLPAVPG